MECGEAAADDDGRELEAAEALAGLAQHVAVSQDQLVADYAPLKITSVRRIPTEQCSKSHRMNPVIEKMRRKLTEAEKEERKLRHIMANRESARQTIRRKQAMHMELNKKAADELEENENLKKASEARKAAAGVTEEEVEPNSFCSATAMTPMFLQQNQPPPSLVPCFWPPMASTSDAFPFQGTSRPHPLQFPMDTPPCLHQGQELSTVTPMFIVPVPWVLPLLGTNTRCCGKCSCSDARMSEDNNNNKSCSNQNAMSADGDRRTHEPPAGIVVPGLFSPVRCVENLDPPRAFQVGDHVVSAHETGLFRGKSEDIIVATEARRRRKELMRLKKVN
ncbi:hypothetical protein SASPL_105553 [Salvia splendens]|uniref:BZIP domain-containing protein n=1 Tax=Salvia splendens TaxID=180675 RepID=A0A8X9ABP6_SALSN|nr:hypothetical protein SASPL_105553 [Salvia splendens]